MKLISQTSITNGVSIHYLDSHPDSDFSLTPLLICPGLSKQQKSIKIYLNT